MSTYGGLARDSGTATGAATGTGQGFFSGTVALTTNSIQGGFELRDPSRGSQRGWLFGIARKWKGSEPKS